jgi:hypothetical protein
VEIRSGVRDFAAAESVKRRVVFLLLLSGTNEKENEKKMTGKERKN